MSGGADVAYADAPELHARVVDFTPAAALECLVTAGLGAEAAARRRLAVPRRPVYVLVLEEGGLAQVPPRPRADSRVRVYVGKGDPKRWQYARALLPQLGDAEGAQLLAELDAPKAVVGWQAEGFRLFTAVIFDPSAAQGFEHFLARALDRFRPGEVDGGLLGLRWLVHVEDCLTTQSWHDEDACVLCGSRAHFAVDCELKGCSPRLPALRVGQLLEAADTAMGEVQRQLAAAVARADAAEALAAAVRDAAHAGAAEGGRDAVAEAQAAAAAAAQAKADAAAAWPTEAAWGAYSYLQLHLTQSWNIKTSESRNIKNVSLTFSFFIARWCADAPPKCEDRERLGAVVARLEVEAELGGEAARVVPLARFARESGAAPQAARLRAKRTDAERDGGETDAKRRRHAAGHWIDKTWPKHAKAAEEAGWCTAEQLQVHQPTCLLGDAAKARVLARAKPKPKAKAKAKSKAAAPIPPCDRPPKAVRSEALLALYGRQ